jgi:hypothetical protein
MSSILSTQKMVSEINDVLKADVSIGKNLCLKMSREGTCLTKTINMCELTVKEGGRYKKDRFMVGVPLKLYDFYIGKRAGPIFVFSSGGYKVIEIALKPSRYSSANFIEVVGTDFVSLIFNSIKDMLENKAKTVKENKSANDAGKYQSNPLFGIF